MSDEPPEPPAPQLSPQLVAAIEQLTRVRQELSDLIDKEFGAWMPDEDGSGVGEEDPTPTP